MNTQRLSGCEVSDSCLNYDNDDRVCGVGGEIYQDLDDCVVGVIYWQNDNCVWEGGTFLSFPSFIAGIGPAKSQLLDLSIETICNSSVH